MSWDYADMSKDASEHGGPKQYINSIFESGREYEHEAEKPEKLLVGLVSFGIGSLFTFAISKAVTKWNKKKEDILQKADAQKCKLMEAVDEQKEIEQVEPLPDSESASKKEI